MSKWIEGKLRDLVEVNPAVKLIKGEIYPFVSMDVIQPFYKPVEAKEEREFKSGGAKFENGDTLFARITPCLENGKIAQVKNLKNGKGFGSTEFIVLRGKEGITDTDFVYYLVTNKSFRENAERLMVGTSGRQRVDKQQFEDQIISIPDLETQKRISSILGSIDKKIELNIEMNKTLEEMAMTLYKDWFVDFGPFQDGEFVESELGMIPKGWRVGTLNELVLISTNSVNPKKIHNETLIHYSIPAFDNGKLPEINKATEVKSNKYRINKNCILVSKLNPRLFRIWTVYINEKVKGLPVCSTEFINYEIRETLDWGFLNCYLRDKTFVDKFRSFAHGTTGSRQRVTPKVTLEFKLVIPPKKIRDEFNSICKPYWDLIHKNILESEQLKKIRDYLLPRLLSGEIKVSEAKEQVQEVLNNA